MQYTQLGDSGIEVSTIALGCWGLIGGLTWGPQAEETSIAVVHEALDAGITFFDTAEGYGAGASEALVGRALKGIRQEVVIATKVSSDHLAAPDVHSACERSLRALDTDYVDLYQIHWPSRTVPFGETWAALEALQAAGRIRAIGVSNFGPRDLEDMLDWGRAATNQLPYSLLSRAIEYEVLPRCIVEGIGVLCYSPLAQGLLTGKFGSPEDVADGRARTRHFSSERLYARHGEEGCEGETFAAIDRVRAIAESLGAPMANVALAWLRHQQGVTSIVAGARTPSQIRETARAADLRLSDDVVAQLARATDEVKRLLGPNPDLWQADSRYR